MDAFGLCGGGYPVDGIWIGGAQVKVRHTLFGTAEDTGISERSRLYILGAVAVL